MTTKHFWNFDEASELAQEIKNKGYEHLIVTDGSFAYTDRKTGEVLPKKKRQIANTTAAAVQAGMDKLPEDMRKKTAFLVLVNSQHSDTVVYELDLAIHSLHPSEKKRIENALSLVGEQQGKDKVFAITFNGLLGATVLKELLDQGELVVEEYYKMGWGNKVERPFVSLPEVKCNTAYRYQNEEKPFNSQGGVWAGQPEDNDSPYDEREAMGLEKLKEFSEECPSIVLPSVESAMRMKAGKPVPEGFAKAVSASLYEDLGPHKKPYLDANDTPLFNPHTQNPQRSQVRGRGQPAPR